MKKNVDPNKCWTKTKHCAPFDKAGNLLPYPNRYIKNRDWKTGTYEEVDDSVWKDVTLPFPAFLKLLNHARGRSSVTFIFEDTETKAQYKMFLSDMVDLIKSDAQREGPLFRGQWLVTKKGANYGIKFSGREEALKELQKDAQENKMGY